MRYAIPILALLLAGCAARPLDRVDSTGRSFQAVEADKLACWQEGQVSVERPPVRYGPLIVGLVSPIAGAIYEGFDGAEDRRAWDARIEQYAQGCMQRRGYTLR